MTEHMRNIPRQRGRVIRSRNAHLVGPELSAAYRKAIAAYQDASTQLQDQANALRQFLGDITRAPGNVCFERIAGEPDCPLRQLASRRWDARDFPNPRSLQAALLRRHQALRTMRNLWEKMPAAARQQCAAPPKS